MPSGKFMIGMAFIWVLRERAHEQLRPALKLLFGFTLLRHDQRIDAAAVLMQPVHVVAGRTHFEVQMSVRRQAI